MGFPALACVNEAVDGGANLSNVRKIRCMDTSTEPTNCEHCGAKIPLRLGPQGRVKRFCSDACRAAASRERRKREHQEALAAARQQMTLDLRTPDDSAREAAETLREIAAALRAGERPLVTSAVGDLIQAGQELDAAMAAVNAAESTPPRMNRAQRRRAQRRG